jgi:ubiquinone/menaquinone biosynthesis C-methylase UbiE
MSHFIDERIKRIATAGRIVDVGGGHGLQKGLEKYKSRIGHKCVSLDYDPNTKPDIVGDIMALPFEDNSQEAYISMSVLEHVDNPHKAVDELYRTLRAGGMGLLYVPFLIPYHAREGAYYDYYRFTKDAVRNLFSKFSVLEMEPSRRFFEAWFLMLPKIGDKLSPLGVLLDRALMTGDRQVGGYNIFVIK